MMMTFKPSRYGGNYGQPSVYPNLRHRSDAKPAREELISQDEESPSGGPFNGGGEDAFGGNVGVGVEEVGAGNAHVVEVELGVVDPVESDFVTHVVNRHARTHGHVFVSRWGQG